MNFSIRIDSNDQDFAVNSARSLKEWLENEEIDDLGVKQERRSLKEDEAGAGLLEGVLAITLASPVVAALVKSIHVWFREKTKQQVHGKSKFKMIFQSSNGDTIYLESENIRKTEKNLIKMIMDSTKNS